MRIYQSKEYISETEKQQQVNSQMIAKELLKNNPSISSKELIRIIRQKHGIACERTIKSIYMQHRRSL